MSKIAQIAGRVGSYKFVNPDYKTLIQDTIELLEYLKENPSKDTEVTFRPTKSLFWELVMRIAESNMFTTHK